MTDTMDLETMPWTTLMEGWSEAEGKHAQMHLLRQATILGARTVMKEVGIDPDKNNDRTSYDNIATRWGMDMNRSSSRIISRSTNLIPLGEREDASELGLEYEFARIDEDGRRYVEEEYALLHLPGRPRVKSRHENYEPQFTIWKFAGESAKHPQGTAVIPGSKTEMMWHPNIDMRSLWECGPEDMAEHYQQQINQLLRFAVVLEELAEAACTSLPDSHIRELLKAGS